MKTIWKYALDITDMQTVEVPESASILSVATQGDIPVLYAHVDPENPSTTLGVRIYGTGNPADVPEGYRFVGTISTHDGALWWHVFAGEGR